MKEIIEKIGKSKLAMGLACLAACFAIAGLLTAATTIGVATTSPAISSANNASVTNAHFGVATNGVWPGSLIGGDLMTNLVPVDVSAYKEVTIEVAGASMNTPGAAAGQTVVWTVYKNVAGGSPTNSVGTGLLLETAGTITNTFTSGTAGAQVVSSLTLSGGNAGAAQTGLAGQLGGATTLYIGKADASTLTNTTYYTNYTVWVKGK